MVRSIHGGIDEPGPGAHLHGRRDSPNQLTQTHTEEFHEKGDEQLEEGSANSCSTFPETHRIDLQILIRRIFGHA